VTPTVIRIIIEVKRLKMLLNTHMPRTRSKKWMDFEDAKAFVQSQGVQSRQQFIDWYDANKPARLSKYPPRVYTKERNGWNDFLGTNNEFNKTRRNWRSFSEAILWVHQLGIQGGKPAWLEWVKEHGEEKLPEDIPKRPDIVYSQEWMTWKHWLGDKITERVEAQQKAREASIYYIIREQQHATVDNVYTVGVEPRGVAGLKERWEVEKFQVVKMFQFESSKAPQVEAIVGNLTKSYFGEHHVRAVPNIHELCWELNNELDVVK
jgi:hypothetical protein